jgi:SNF2 family DNA or RNA helicase
MIKLLPHQEKCLKQLEGRNRVAIYHDMGLGKTFTGSEKMMQLDAGVNLIICQKSKVRDWVEHFFTYYIDKTKCDESGAWCYDLTTQNGIDMFTHSRYRTVIGVINYDLIFRRPELLKLKDFTLMLDESSLICNEQTKRAKAVLKMQPLNVILLSGTPTAGKYEKLWTQCKLLGWNISKQVFWNSYIITKWVDYGAGFMQQVVTGYKMVDHLKKKLAEHGAVFLKTEEVLNLPEQIEQKVMLKRSKEYNRFIRDGYLELKDGTELYGDNTLTKMLYARMLCGQYHTEKLEAFRDILNSTEENLVVFYNFNGELEALEKIAKEEGRTPGAVNGHQKDSTEGKDILFVQYQAGAYGLNLQGFSNRIIYFTLPLGKGSCDMWEQSKKRIHRIGQNKTCFYYYLLVSDSIETTNLMHLKEGKDYTDYLFEGGQK